ncbi:MAG: cupin-like domain-containing protein [Sandaracinaceae bacterium]
MSAKRRPAKRRPSRDDAPALAPEWRRWVAENLVQGAKPEVVIEALIGQGVPQKEARARVEETLASPLFAIAAAATRRWRRYAQVLRLHAEQHATRARPEAVERVERLDGEAFFERYYATNTPVVLPDLMDGWAARKWTPSAFAARFGDVEVGVCEGRDGDADYDMHAAALSGTTTMAALIARIEATEASNDFYMIARNRNLEGPLRALLDDVGDTRGILDRDRLVGGCQLWVGPAGTVTPFHHDTSNILFCQLYGRKRFLLAPPVERRLLDAPRAMYATIDPGDPESGLALRAVELGPGDALFLPVGWWHHVRALDTSISVAFVAFTRDNDRRWYTPGKL